MKNNSKTGKIAKVRSAGFFTKGLVYFLIGALTFMAALGLGGDISSKDGVISFLLQLPLGKILVGIVALGLFAYSLWRLYQIFREPIDQNGKTKENFRKGFKKFRYFYSGILYAFIAYSFAKPLIQSFAKQAQSSGGSGDNETQKAALGELLSHSWGPALIWIAAIIVAGQALRQFYLAYTAQFMKKIDNYPNIKHEYDLIRNAGRIGYSARGVVFGVLSFFLVKVILQHNANAYKGTEGALQYLLSYSYGSFLLAAVALGLIGYGIFNMMVARHANFTTLN
ncbi:MAG: DUF1206 domain-containing protein [Salegentibacter sp.]